MRFHSVNDMAYSAHASTSPHRFSWRPPPHYLSWHRAASPIFQDDIDRDDFVGRLAALCTETSTKCLAWTLIPNHFYLLLQTGTIPVATIMRRLLTGYAVRFNRRQGRHGHLFQNRYKSILCQEELYLLELVRYIHLNPLRAGQVNSLEELKVFPY